MIYETLALGIFGDGSEDLYEEDMSVEKFKDNYSSICKDLNDVKVQEATEAFAQIATEYPEAVEDNGERLYELCMSESPEVQRNSITALVLADFEYGGQFLGENTYDVLNAMIEHKNRKLRETASDLLMKGVRDYNYYIYGKNANVAMHDKDSVMVRLRAAQALRMYINRTSDYKQLDAAKDGILENFEPAIENLDDEWWYEMAKEVLKLLRLLMYRSERVADGMPQAISDVIDTDDGDLITLAMEVSAELPKARASTFSKIEPIMNSMLSENVDDSLREYAIASYKRYTEQSDDMSVVKDSIDSIVEYYQSLGMKKFQKEARNFCLLFFWNLTRHNVDITEVLKNVSMFEKELEDMISEHNVFNALNLYLASLNKIGIQPLKGHIDYVPRYLDSNNPKIREAAATVLMSFVQEDMEEIKRLDVTVDKIKSVLEEESEEIDNADRIENKRQEETIEDAEEEYLTKNPDVDFSNYVGMEQLKKEAKKKIIEPLREPELHKEFGVDIQRGFLFYGPPGTGKTYFAKALAGEFDLSYIEVDAADLTSKWIGQPAQNVQDMFEVAVKNEPCIIFIDEIDALATDRESSQQHKAQRQLVNQMLQSITRINDEDNDVVVIGATNRVEDVDSAVLRTRRLGEKIKFDKPDGKTRVEIFRKSCKPDTQELSDEWLERKTRNMVHSDVTEFANQTSYNALERYKETGEEKSITTEDAERALEKMKDTEVKDDKNDRKRGFN